jgi:O-acetyl-ADP-ribose deacetylase (regulator of RNase III)
MPVEFTTVQGDIAERSADALVNTAGTSLRMGSGVAGALHRGADGSIGEAAVAEGAELICEEIHDYAATTLDDMRVIAYSPADHETLPRVATDVGSYGGSASRTSHS